MANSFGIGMAILYWGSLGVLITISAISLWRFRYLLANLLGNAELRERWKGKHSIGIVEGVLFFLMEATTYSPPLIPREIALCSALFCGTLLILLCAYKVKKLFPLIRSKQPPLTMAQALVIPILFYSIFNYFMVYANYVLLAR